MALRRQISSNLEKLRLGTWAKTEADGSPCGPRTKASKEMISRLRTSTIGWNAKLNSKPISLKLLKRALFLISLCQFFIMLVPFDVAVIVLPMLGGVVRENIYCINSPIYFHFSHDSGSQADV